MESMKSTKTEKDIYNEVTKIIKEFELDTSKLFGITIDVFVPLHNPPKNLCINYVNYMH